MIPPLLCGLSTARFVKIDKFRGEARGERSYSYHFKSIKPTLYISDAQVDTGGCGAGAED